MLEQSLAAARFPSRQTRGAAGANRGKVEAASGAASDNASASQRD